MDEREESAARLPADAASSSNVELLATIRVHSRDRTIEWLESGVKNEERARRAETSRSNSNDFRKSLRSNFQASKASITT